MWSLNEKLGTTFLFCTHDEMVMDYARRLVHLKDGVISDDERRSA
jgi:putative ABC transport system ATP-binding protein